MPNVLQIFLHPKNDLVFHSNLYGNLKLNQGLQAKSPSELAESGLNVDLSMRMNIIETRVGKQRFLAVDWTTSESNKIRFWEPFKCNGTHVEFHVFIMPYSLCRILRIPPFILKQMPELELTISRGDIVVGPSSSYDLGR